MSTAKTATVIGGQFGDEGKGKVVDMLAPDFDMVVRFQGGNNAGHTLVVGGEKTVLHQIPSGVLHPGIHCAIGAGCVVNPMVLVEEMESLSKRGIHPDDRMSVAGNAAVIMPIHRRLDAARESAAGSKMIGTTLRGIGPTYEDRASRTAILIQDLLDLDRLHASMKKILGRRNPELEACGAEPMSAEENIEEIRPAISRLAPLIQDVALQVSDSMGKGRGVLFEGAQGCLLDRNFGTLPFVTSSNTGFGAVSVGVGVPPHLVDRRIAVVKAYQTRVGSGPFPTELEGPALDHLRTVGGEFGATTGRPRRCGWLDLPLLRYAHTLNGFGAMVLTKLDVLQGLDEIKVCTHYRLNGENIKRLGPWSHDFQKVEPVYESLDGFSEDLGQVSDWNDLPESVRKLVDFVETQCGAPIAMISMGPGREQVVRRPGALI